MAEAAANGAAPYRLPAAFVQEWFFGADAADASVFPVAVTWRLDGPLRTENVQRALDRLVVNHEALRTSLWRAGNAIEQHVHGDRSLTLELVDCSASHRDFRPQLRRRLRQPFRFEADRLARATLFRLGPCAHVLLLIVHHAVSDGMSNAVLREEFAIALRAELTAAPDLPPAPLQFADYAGWERAKAQRVGGSGEERPAPRPPRLAIEPRRSSWRMSDGFLACGQRIPDASPALVRRLAEVARSVRAPLGSALIAAIALASPAQIGDDLLLGVMRANREDPRLRRTVGFLATPLPVSISLAPDRSFRSLVEQVVGAQRAAEERNVSFAAFTAGREALDEVHRHHPFDVIANYLPHHPWDQHTVDAAGASLRIRGADVEREDLRMSTAAGRGGFGLLDYQFLGTPTGGIAGYLVANERIVPVAAVTAWARAFWPSLRSPLLHPDRPLGAGMSGAHG